jgi:hypothetical protein
VLDINDKLAKATLSSKQRKLVEFRSKMIEFYELPNDDILAVD